MFFQGYFDSYVKMISINIVCVGNLKEKFWKEAVDEYCKRLSAFAKIKIVEVKEAIYGTEENTANHKYNKCPKSVKVG